MARVARKPSSSSASSGRCPKPTKVTQKPSSKSSTSSAGSIKRQTSAAKQAAQRDSTPLKVKLSEVVSGSLPYDQRAALKSLVERTHPMLKGCADKVKIFLESARALARSQIAAEQAWQASRKHNVEIVCSDIPDLFTHSPTPAQSFIRKVHCAAQEFNKDMVVYHLSQGLAKKVKTTKEITQKGSPKAGKLQNHV